MQARLIVEIEDQAQGSYVQEQWHLMRNTWLVEKGYHILKMKHENVLQDIEEVAAYIFEEVTELGWRNFI